MSSDAPSHANPLSVRPDDPSLLALLVVARVRGLHRKSTHNNLLCPGSAAPFVGWYQQAGWAENEAAWEAGGPWSVEFVSAAAGLGLLSINPERPRAEITKAGRAFLKEAQAQASTSNRKDGSSPKTLEAPDHG